LHTGHAVCETAVTLEGPWTEGWVWKGVCGAGPSSGSAPGCSDWLSHATVKSAPRPDSHSVAVSGTLRSTLVAARERMQPIRFARKGQSSGDAINRRHF